MTIYLIINSFFFCFPYPDLKLISFLMIFVVFSLLILFITLIPGYITKYNSLHSRSGAASVSKVPVIYDVEEQEEAKEKLVYENDQVGVSTKGCTYKAMKLKASTVWASAPTLS